MEERGMSRNVSRASRHRVIFKSRVSIVVALMLAATAVIGPSPAFAQRKSAEDCKAAFMNKCLADCRQRAGKQCDWFCGRRSTYAC
jgi:hypothetical protein